MQNERKILVSALLKAEKNGYSNIILDSVLNEADLNSVGKAFVTNAFYGVLERKITIDFILNKFLKKPKHLPIPQPCFEAVRIRCFI